MLPATRTARKADALLHNCPICLDAFQAPTLLRCMHRFCEQCITAALRIKMECPTCRAPVGTIRELRADLVLTDIIGCETSRALAAPPSASGAGDHSWVCGDCTLQNPLAAGRCLACAARRPASAVRLPAGGHEGANAMLDGQGQERKRKRRDESVARRLPTLAERVQGKYQGADGGLNWFYGVVTRVREDGTCDIRYDDGDEEEAVEARFIRTREHFTKAIASQEAPPSTPPSTPLSTRAEGREEPAAVSTADDATGAVEGASAADQDERHEAGEPKHRTEPTEPTGADVFMGLPAAEAPVELHSLGGLVGTYATPEDAAAAFRQELAAEDGHRELSMTWGRLRLHPSLACETGFRGVQRSHKCKSFVAIYSQTYLGSFATAGQAAKAYARHAANVNPRPDSNLVLRPGVELYRTSRNETGFTGVFCTPSGRFRAHCGEARLGTFATAEAAAIAYANCRPPPKVDEDWPVEEALELITSDASSTGFKGVCKSFDTYVAKYDRTVLGRFRMAEAAAAAYARHVQDPAFRKRSRWDGHDRKWRPH